MYSASKFRAADPSRIEILHPAASFVERFVLREAFVIGRDAGRDVLRRLLPAQPGCMPIHRLAAIVCRLHFRQAARVAVQNARESSSSR